MSDLALALGCVPSGLFIVTAGTATAATGFLASFVQQVGFDPPVVTVAVGKGRPIEQLIRDGGGFCVSVLRDGDKQLLSHFARGFEPGQPAFDGVDSELDERGIPMLVGALSNLSCRLRGEAEWTDHVLFAGEVTAGVHRGEGRPAVHVRKNGLGY